MPENGFLSLEDAVGLSLRDWVRRRCQRFLYRYSRIAKETIDEPGGWKTLDLIYGNDPEALEPGTYSPRGIIDSMFFYSPAAKATRERHAEYGRLMRRLVRQHVAAGNNTVRILDVASGPGRDLVELLAEFGAARLHVTFIDASPSAIEKGKRIAEERNVSQGAIFIRGNVANLRSLPISGKYNVVVMQGILDYFSPRSATALLAASRELLVNDGTILAGNMDNHHWIRFWMEAFGNWRLRYKNRETIEGMFREAGLSNPEVYKLQGGYHWVAIGRK